MKCCCFQTVIKNNTICTCGQPLWFIGIANPFYNKTIDSTYFINDFTNTTHLPIEFGKYFSQFIMDNTFHLKLQLKCVQCFHCKQIFGKSSLVQKQIFGFTYYQYRTYDIQCEDDPNDFSFLSSNQYRYQG
jgi:hypothetical protein